MSKKQKIILIASILVIALVVTCLLVKNTLLDMYYYKKYVTISNTVLNYMEKLPKHYHNGKLDAEGEMISKKIEEMAKEGDRYARMIRTDVYKKKQKEVEKEFIDKTLELMDRYKDSIKNQ